MEKKDGQRKIMVELNDIYRLIKNLIKNLINITYY